VLLIINYENKTMKLIKIIILISLITNNLFAYTSYFNEGVEFYEMKNFEKAKFKFEQDIVFNPKNEKSYLYLSRIFKLQDKKNLQEKNLNTVLLLNPKNEEATYNLAKLKLEESDYTKSKELINKLLSNCDKYCKKSELLKVEIEKSFKK